MTLKAGQGTVTITGSQTTWRSWPRSLWPVVANSVYHGPSSAVGAADIKALSAAVAQERGEQPQPEPTTAAPEVKAAVAPAGTTRGTVTVRCQLAKSRRAVTFTIAGAKGASLRAELALGKAKARRSARGTVTVTVRSTARLNATSRVTVNATSGKSAGRVRARAGRCATITLR